MSPTLHKILMHGGDIIRQFPPTITSGMLSEEPGESSNKDIKHVQLAHARQSSLTFRNLDTFLWLIGRSDPVILTQSTMNKKVPKKVTESYPQAVLDFCDAATPYFHE